MTDETETAAERISRVAARYGLAMTAEFVPFSLSRNAKPSTFNGGKPWRGLNWRVTLTRNGAPLVGPIDYSQGEAHCPAYKAKAFGDNRAVRERAIALECETGRRALGGVLHPEPRASAERLPGPSLVVVLASLSLDASVIDHPSFESWAEELGYSTDSREAEAVYRQCLQIALAMRAALGDDGLQELREAASDY